RLVARCCGVRASPATACQTSPAPAAPRRHRCPAWEAPQAAAGQPRQSPMAGKPPPRASAWAALEAVGGRATVSLRFADSATIRCPTRYAPSPWCARKAPALRQAAVCSTSVALQFCAAEAGCPVDIGEMLRLPGINEVTAEIGRKETPLCSLFLALPYNFGGTAARKALSDWAPRSAKTALLADELEALGPVVLPLPAAGQCNLQQRLQACQCHPQGALNKTCDPLSGQCSCRGITVGRTCDRCPIGYFSFPECKKCDCPGGLLCSEPDGECICPRNVAGKKCDRCEPGNYGYNVVTGCMPCRCNSLGTTNGSATCDLVTGQCSAATLPFRAARSATAPPRGVTEEICSAESGACACKENVAPPTCSRCKAGFFNLDPANPSGCTAASGSGLPNATCTEAAARMVTQLNDVLFSHPAGSNFDSSANLLIPVERLTNETVRLYLGRLRLSMRLEFDGAPAAAELDSFLTLWTNQGGSLRHRIMQAGRTPGQELRVELLLHEFVHQPERVVMSRLQFLNFLAGCAASLWPMAVVGNVRGQDASLRLAVKWSDEVLGCRPASDPQRRGALACRRRSQELLPAAAAVRSFIATSGRARAGARLTIKPAAATVSQLTSSPAPVTTASDSATALQPGQC
uniref:EGF-like domain-containing protein n=1 Tax=Macrostomum lignano TaxID=282301 RepID=A0A1I8FAY5_9PLAT